MPQFSSITDYLAHSVSFKFVLSLKGHTRSKMLVSKHKAKLGGPMYLIFGSLVSRLVPHTLGGIVRLQLQLETANWS